MAVEEEPTKTAVKSEIDLYGDDDNFEQLQNDEVIVGDVMEEDLHNEDENAALVQGKTEGGTTDASGDVVEEHTGAEDDAGAIDRRQSEADDLYDAVITDRTSPALSGRHSREENGDSTSPSPGLRTGHTMVTGSGTMSQAQRKNSCYVGNLTWWTTDQDLTEVVSAIGISDLIDVKFYENRANGQSKGFALVSFETENSVRMCIERLSSKQLHGQAPVVMQYTKQSLAQLEAATRKPGERVDTGAQPGTPTGRAPATALTTGSGGTKVSVGPQDKGGPTFLGVLRIGAGGQPRGPPSGPGGMSGGQVGLNPLAAAVAAAAAVRSSIGMAQGPPMMLPNSGPGGMIGPGMPPHGGGYPGMMRPHVSMGPGMPGVGPPPMVSRPPPHGMMAGGGGYMGPMGHQGMPHYGGGGPVMGGQHAPGGMPPPGVPPPGSHVNPKVYPGWAVAQQQQQQQAAPGHHHHDGGGGAGGGGGGGGILNEAEFEEIMNRNRTVSSSAISRAVSDAAAGDYASAIETLVTALSLIRQSKVAHDDRCKVLIGSLQDTLHGIEAKSYGSGGGGGSHHGASSGSGSRRSKDRGSGRDRSRSRDRTGGGGSKRRHRSRTRSRSRDRYADEYSPRRSRRY